MKSLSRNLVVLLVVGAVVFLYVRMETRISLVKAYSPPGLGTVDALRKSITLKYSLVQPHRKSLPLGFLRIVPEASACGLIPCDGTENKPVPPGGQCAFGCTPWICEYTGNMKKACQGPFYNTAPCTLCRYDHNVPCNQGSCDPNCPL